MVKRKEDRKDAVRLETVQALIELFDRAKLTKLTFEDSEILVQLERAPAPEISRETPSQ